MKKRYAKAAMLGLVVFLTACGRSEAEQQTPTGNPVTKLPQQPTITAPQEPTRKPEPTGKPEEEKKVMPDAERFANLIRTECEKGIKNNNPLITQEFGADPFAMVYGDTLYVYMTQDAFEKTGGVIGENTYGKIQSIRVISTKDMVNWTDHGAIKVAGTQGVARWARNSWAPAAAWKTIDGKDQFFLYFADSGNGIGVLQADSPVGPFHDPVGGGMITRNTPNCADVLWLFDPAVFVDDDGRAYIYFGGGVPQDQVSHPMTGRVAELNEDMISLKGEPQTLDAPYLFEDSGIHKFGDKYYYTYCSNWQVDAEGTATYGFHNAEIVSMESDSPMGPFTFKETILANPGSVFGLYGNNHHSVFRFQGSWYIAYHTRVLEQSMGIEKGYRCTFINSFEIKEDGTIGKITQSRKGCEQIHTLDPYEVVNACTFSHQGGLAVTGSDPLSNYYGAGEMALTSIDSGDFLKVTGVDFSYREPEEIKLLLRKTAELTDDCVMELRLDSFTGTLLGYVKVKDLLEGTEISDTFTEVTAKLTKKPEGVHNLYMTFSGSGYELLSWQFQGSERSWYDNMVEQSLLSAGENGRLERVMQKLANKEAVDVAFIGGSVTEGAGASVITESYADRVIAWLKMQYPEADIRYVNAGLGGTPSSLGIMRYHRDVVAPLKTEPDLLFIEFSVNDYQEATNGRAFESLIRTALEENEKTAVCLVFAVFQSKWNMQDNYIPMGDLYGLPMVSIKDATRQPFEEKRLTDAAFFSDEYHPTSFGHEIMADCVTYLLSEAAKKEIPAQVAAVPEQRITSNAFQGTRLVTADETNGATVMPGSFSSRDTAVHGFMRSGSCAFPDNWQYDGTTGSEPFMMKVTCKNLLINYKQSSAKEAGAVLVYVDGELVKEINSYQAGGWNQSMVELLIDQEKAAEHTITICRKEGDEGKSFTLLAFSYTE